MSPFSFYSLDHKVERNVSVSVHPISCLHVLIAPSETLHRKWAWHQLIRWASKAKASPLGSIWNRFLRPEEERLLTANQSNQLD